MSKPNHQSGKSKKGFKSSVNYNSRLIQKMIWSKETPESVFDISVCNLKTIPDGVFTQCRVLRKEALYLQNNNLTKLSCIGCSLGDLSNLKVLDISANNFSYLPSNINELENLEVLNCSKNELLELPETIGGLVHLRNLNISYNHLKLLPNSIGNCKNMMALNLTYNENLKQLPVTLAKLKFLAQLQIDHSVNYPPREICKQGVSKILEFLSLELSDNLEVPSTSAKVLNQDLSSVKLQEKIKFYEQKKLQKQNELLLLEKEMKDKNQKEFEIQQNMKMNKTKLIENIKNQQKSLDAEITKLQNKKNINRAMLIQICQDEEKKSNEIVGRILNARKGLKMQYTKEWLKESKAEEERLLSHKNESKSSGKMEILASMEELMAAEILKAGKIKASKRSCVSANLAFEIMKEKEALMDLLRKRDITKAELLQSLHENEELQKSAVALLMEKSDTHSWELAQQIAIIENQLRELTKIELAKKKLKSESQLNELSMNRVALTELLMDLLKRQTERREELIEILRKMELMKTSVRDSEIFWMEQYYKLLNSKGHEMVKFFETVDRKLLHLLFVNEVLQYLPLLKAVALSKDELKKLNHSFLTKCGIVNVEDQNKILRAVQTFLNPKNSYEIVCPAPLPKKPSAPMANVKLDQPVANFILGSDECVICMESKPSVVFLPCGHFCCCFKCSASISLCPLCRAPIDSFFERTMET